MIYSPRHSPRWINLYTVKLFLKTRRDLRDLEMLYKELVWDHSRARGHERRYRQIGGSVNAHKHSFL